MPKILLIAFVIMASLLPPTGMDPARAGSEVDCCAKHQCC
jgi:hypothetical protein